MKEKTFTQPLVQLLPLQKKTENKTTVSEKPIVKVQTQNP